MGLPFRWQARYTVLVILFISWIVSYTDRMAMSVAIPYIAADFHLNSVQMGVVMSAFFASYSLSHIPGGVLADLFGIRKVSALALLWWSVFTSITGAAGNLTQMLTARFLFGLGEGIYPACVFKAVAIWFPPKERATANGIRMAAAPLGTALSPLVVVAIMSYWNWRTVFYALFLPGIVISLLVWIFIRDRPADSPRVSPQELAEIEAGRVTAARGTVPRVKMLTVFREPNILKYFFVLFTFDIAYWGFTTWLPTYLLKARGFSMTQMGVAASLPFFAGTIACVGGGWISDKYFSNSRRTPIVATQLIAVVLLYLTSTAGSTAAAVLYQTLAGLFLNFFFTCFWALPMNSVPKEVMGVASGFINMAGQIAAFISPLCIGYLIDTTGGSFQTTFILLMGAILTSTLIVLTVPNTLPRRSDALHENC